MFTLHRLRIYEVTYIQQSACKFLVQVFYSWHIFILHNLDLQIEEHVQKYKLKQKNCIYMSPESTEAAHIATRNI